MKKFVKFYGVFALTLGTIGILYLVYFLSVLWADSTHDKRYLTKTIEKMKGFDVITVYNVDGHWNKFFHIMDTIKGGQTIMIGKNDFFVNKHDSSLKSYYQYDFDNGKDHYSLRVHIGECNKNQGPAGTIKYAEIRMICANSQEKYHKGAKL